MQYSARVVPCQAIQAVACVANENTHGTVKSVDISECSTRQAPVGPHGRRIATVRRLLESLVRRGLLDGDGERAMQAWAHGDGFSVDAAVRTRATVALAERRRPTPCRAVVNVYTERFASSVSFSELGLEGLFRLDFSRLARDMHNEAGDAQD